ncbi:hypothetical protein [Nonomuraea monospora]|uniref:hypothetical protein n=1 Tax=Nonomuraea monospora TaxID=568818 RepID=UPI003CD073B6
MRRVDGRVVPGSYAVGEVIGSAAVNGNAFCSGMCLTPALAFGRLVGRALAAPWPRRCLRPWLLRKRRCQCSKRKPSPRNRPDPTGTSGIRISPRYVSPGNPSAAQIAPKNSAFVGGVTSSG